MQTELEQSRGRREPWSLRTQRREGTGPGPDPGLLAPSPVPSGGTELTHRAGPGAGLPGSPLSGPAVWGPGLEFPPH